jgi:hypothetical protein
MQFVDVVDAPVEPPIGATKVEPALVSMESKVNDLKLGTAIPPQQPAREGVAVGVKFKSVTVTKGATVNLGINVGAARFDVSATVECGDFDSGYAAALAHVERALDAEVEKFQGMKGGAK